MLYWVNFGLSFTAWYSPPIFMGIITFLSLCMVLYSEEDKEEEEKEYYKKHFGEDDDMKEKRREFTLKLLNGDDDK